MTGSRQEILIATLNDDLEQDLKESLPQSKVQRNSKTRKTTNNEKGRLYLKQKLSLANLKNGKMKLGLVDKLLGNQQ